MNPDTCGRGYSIRIRIRKEKSTDSKVFGYLATHIQYTQRDTIRHVNTLTNRRVIVSYWKIITIRKNSLTIRAIGKNRKPLSRLVYDFKLHVINK